MGNQGLLVGKWFHSFSESGIRWQGQVLGSLNDNYFLIQLYSWLDGRETDQKLVSLAEMTKWSFYDSDQDMREASAERR